MPTSDVIEESNKKEITSSRQSASEKIWYESDMYVIVFTVVILIDLICMGMNTFILPSWLTLILRYVDYFIQLAFILDIIVKLVYEKMKFFKSFWNWLDLFVTVVTAIPFGSWSQYSRVIRSVRVARSFRAFSHLHHLRDLVAIIADSMRGVLWTIILLIILFYCYAVVGTLMFGVKFNDWFGSLWKSMYTLFQIMTLEAWSDSIARPVIAEFPSSWIYFISFVIFSAFIMMNVVVGIIVDTTHETQKRQRDLDNNPELIIPYEELEAIIDNLMKHQVKELCRKLHNLADENRLEEMEMKLSDKGVDGKRLSMNFNNHIPVDKHISLVIPPSSPITSDEVEMQNIFQIGNDVHDIFMKNLNTEVGIISNPIETAQTDITLGQISGDEQIEKNEKNEVNEVNEVNEKNEKNEKNMKNEKNEENEEKVKNEEVKQDGWDEHVANQNQTEITNNQ